MRIDDVTRAKELAVVLAERERQKALALAEAQRQKALELAQQRALAEAIRKQQAEVKTQPTPSRSSAPKVSATAYEATWYTAFCSTGCIGVTASGYDVSNTIYYDGYRILAADGSIPLYTIMRVTLADGTTFKGIVLDRGGDIGLNRLDILVASRDEAIALGRQKVSVEILRRGSD